MTVHEVSAICGVSQEQVRRWIRSGKLKAKSTSRKEGYSIAKKDLLCFVQGTKYSKRFGLASIDRIDNKQILQKRIDAIQKELDKLRNIVDML